MSAAKDIARGNRSLGNVLNQTSVARGGGESTRPGGLMKAGVARAATSDRLGETPEPIFTTTGPSDSAQATSPTRMAGEGASIPRLAGEGSASPAAAALSPAKPIPGGGNLAGGNPIPRLAGEQ